MNVGLNEALLLCVVNLLQDEFDISCFVNMFVWIGGGRREAGMIGWHFRLDWMRNSVCVIGSNISALFTQLVIHR